MHPLLALIDTFSPDNHARGVQFEKLCKWILETHPLYKSKLETVWLWDYKIGAGFGVAISTILLSFNAYTKNYDLGELAQKHKQAANEIWFLREKYLSLLTDLAIGEKPIEQLKNEQDALSEGLLKVYSGPPSTTFKAYKKAQDALQTKEDLIFSVEEIDAFLPNELKRS